MAKLQEPLTVPDGQVAIVQAVNDKSSLVLANGTQTMTGEVTELYICNRVPQGSAGIVDLKDGDVIAEYILLPAIAAKKPGRKAAEKAE